MKTTHYFILLFLTFSVSFSQSIRFDSVPCLSGASIRGMSVVNDSVAWISGSQGTVARTLDGGKTWQKIKVPGYEKSDFRSIEAFDKNFAYIAGTSNPAVILLTKDGGKNWSTEFSKEENLFLDAICCWDRAFSITVADPVNNTFIVRKIVDGNPSLIDTTGLSAATGESCFAASGTCMRIDKRGRAWFVTGGTKSRLFYSRNYGKNWTSFDIPVISGKPSQGAFSLALSDNKHAIVVGGDYSDPKSSIKNCAITTNGGESWKHPQIPPAGYRSCVEYISGKTFICTGTTGSDISFDHGKTWKNFDNTNFNVVRKAKTGKLILVAGDKGKVGVVNLK